MEKFDRYGELLGMIGHERVTRSNIAHCCGGFFMDKLDCYVEQGILNCEKDSGSDERDDMFYLTPLGLKLWQQEISITDIMED